MKCRIDHSQGPPDDSITAVALRSAGQGPFKLSMSNHRTTEVGIVFLLITSHTTFRLKSNASLDVTVIYNDSLQIFRYEGRLLCVFGINWNFVRADAFFICSVNCEEPMVTVKEITYFNAIIRTLVFCLTFVPLSYVLTKVHQIYLARCTMSLTDDEPTPNPLLAYMVNKPPPLILSWLFLITKTM